MLAGYGFVDKKKQPIYSAVFLFHLLVSFGLLLVNFGLLLVSFSLLLVNFGLLLVSSNLSYFLVRCCVLLFAGPFS
ncbi:hypothetical protein KEH51_23175 [[Brevibacterium] frigoritolerans]|uniref:Uncharacterized protein n=1 Tax=Peribacillus frigoritolerans TaxID=450367 RepID=A0A941FLS6_9BACI|nr:hypothetical protein [Peribacillus frigoritolerans]